MNSPILRNIVLSIAVLAILFGLTSPVYAYKREDVYKLVETKKCSQCDISSYQKLSLKHIDLNDANLQGADCQRTNFSGLDLNGVNLSNAKLIEANLSQITAFRINLQKAQLNAANLNGAKLNESNLTNADLDRANLSNSILRKANLRKAILSNAVLVNVDLSDADLRGANLIGANIKGAIFPDEANMRGAIMPDGSTDGSQFKRQLDRERLDEEIAKEIAKYREVIRLNPKLPEAHSNLALALFKQGQLEEASDEYQEAIRLLLAAGELKEANLLTGVLLVQKANRQKEGWLNISDIEKLSCRELRAINQLWVEYSQGRFGYGIQKRILEEVKADYNAFVNRVGWTRRDTWLLGGFLDNDKVNFSLKAPEGHLPFPGDAINTAAWWEKYFFDRVGTCGIDSNSGSS